MYIYACVSKKKFDFFQVTLRVIVDPGIYSMCWVNPTYIICKWFQDLIGINKTKVVFNDSSSYFSKFYIYLWATYISHISLKYIQPNSFKNEILILAVSKKPFYKMNLMNKFIERDFLKTSV